MASSRSIRPLLKTSSRVRLPVPHSGQTSIIHFQSERCMTTIQDIQLSAPSLLINKSRKLPQQQSLRTCLPQARQASSSSSPELKKTPLYKAHEEAGAKMGPFAGFSMPLEYPGQSHPESHKWTRTSASLFDVSHMVQHKLSGPLAEEFLMTITPTAIDTLPKHGSTLSCLLNSEGGIVDDTVITRIGRDSFYFVTNAGCRETDLPFIESQMKSFLESKSASSDQINWHLLDHHALLALQGPKAGEVLQNLVFQDPEEADLDTDLSTLSFGQSRWLQLTLPDEMNTPSLLISRTGYTGEDGFEISIPPENGDSTSLATSIANAFLQLNEGNTVRWAGLAARDSLRLEAGMCLYGHDITEKTTPPMAALGWIIPKTRRAESSSTPKFNGQSIILAHLSDPKTMETRRIGLTIEKGPAAREGAEIIDADNPDLIIGRITSGCPAPSLDGQNIAMGYVKNGYHKKGTKLGVKVRKGVRKGEVVKLPFIDAKFFRAEKKE